MREVNCSYLESQSAGIGRQARLRTVCLLRRVGSTPTSGTTLGRMITKNFY